MVRQSRHPLPDRSDSDSLDDLKFGGGFLLLALCAVGAVALIVAQLIL